MRFNKKKVTATNLLDAVLIVNQLMVAIALCVGYQQAAFIYLFWAVVSGGVVVLEAVYPNNTWLAKMLAVFRGIATATLLAVAFDTHVFLAQCAIWLMLVSSFAALIRPHRQFYPAA